LLAALRHNLVADALALSERGHSGPLYRADVNEYIARAIGRRDEAKALLCVEKFNSTYRHRGLLVAVMKPHVRTSSDAGLNSRVLGDDLNNPAGRSKADQKLVAGNVYKENGRVTQGLRKYVRFWPKADMGWCTAHVGFWG